MQVFLALTLVGSEWSTSRPGCFTPSILWIGCWVGLRAGVDDVEKRKFLTYRDSNPNPLIIQPVVSRCTVYTILAPQTIPVSLVN
jgi:hypothetical protein